MRNLPCVPSEVPPLLSPSSTSAPLLLFPRAFHVIPTCTNNRQHHWQVEASLYLYPRTEHAASTSLRKSYYFGSTDVRYACREGFDAHRKHMAVSRPANKSEVCVSIQAILYSVGSSFLRFQEDWAPLDVICVWL